MTPDAVASVASKVTRTTGEGNGLGVAGAQTRRHDLIVNLLPWAGVQLMAERMPSRVSNEGR